jgi:hypothetical protein
MHYESQPYAMLRRILDRLTPDGLLVLECGVAGGGQKEMVLVQRHSDSRWYPTLPLLRRELLRDYVVRQITYGHFAEGDPIARSVFHCRVRRPTVMLISGQSADGKTALAETLADSAAKLVPLDFMLTRIATAAYHHTPLQRVIRDAHSPGLLFPMYEAIDEHGLTDDFARLIRESIEPADRLVLVEGALTDRQTLAVEAALSGRAAVWHARRALNTPGSPTDRGTGHQAHVRRQSAPSEPAAAAVPDRTRSPAFFPTAPAHISLRLRVLRRLVRASSVFRFVWRNPLVDTEWYLTKYPDVRSYRLGPATHYRRHGAFEDRNPNAYFSTRWYLQRYPDVQRAGFNPLDHYFLYGATEGRDPGPGFSTRRYISAYRDVRPHGMNPLLHYLRVGSAQGRSPNPDDESGV